MLRTLTGLLCLNLLACGSDADPAAPGDTNLADVSASADVPGSTDVIASIDIGETPDAPPADSGPPPSDTLNATDYCELGADVFCDFYLRCGRMAVPDVPTCQTTFVQACNARFEPIYAALADAGDLKLSQAGMSACQAHLDTVVCEQQVFDLDGPCAEMWQGQAAVDEPCGPGIESFVCATGTTCVLGLDFCGTCQPVQPTGAICGEGLRCGPQDSCIAEVCTARLLPGDACDQSVPCRLGTACVDGVCRGDTWVGPGDSCNASATCQYKSVCQGVCVETGLWGTACDTSAGCASGWCEDGQCVPYLEVDDACTSSAACGAGACADGSCTSPTLSCLSSGGS